jgi:hypothetical protein
MTKDDQNVSGGRDNGRPSTLMRLSAMNEEATKKNDGVPVEEVIRLEEIATRSLVELCVQIERYCSAATTYPYQKRAACDLLVEVAMLAKARRTAFGGSFAFDSVGSCAASRWYLTTLSRRSFENKGRACREFSLEGEDPRFRSFEEAERYAEAQCAPARHSVPIKRMCLRCRRRQVFGKAKYCENAECQRKGRL